MLSTTGPTSSPSRAAVRAAMLRPPISIRPFGKGNLLFLPPARIAPNMPHCSESPPKKQGRRWRRRTDRKSMLR